MLTNSLLISIGMTLILWVVHLLNIISGWNLGYFGIRPREVDFWYSIFTGPLIHGDIPHLVSNSIPLLICGTLLFWLYRPVAWTAFTLIYVLTGAAVWLFARPVLHIGFSGVVYGLVAFLFWVGVFRRDMRSIVISLLILVTYSGYFAGIYPNEDGVSWESHLLGGFAGILVALALFRWIPKEKQVREEGPLLDEGEEQYFLPRDTFAPKEDRRDEGNGWWTRDDTW